MKDKKKLERDEFRELVIESKRKEKIKFWINIRVLVFHTSHSSILN